ncbi:MAG TPA: 3-dehydroquinate synthase [Anaerovoracaceae bacterium]|nr:3-dehydroquinate synthase [Anaerovoracaceae bacterium]
MKELKLVGKQNTSKIIIEKGILKEAAEFIKMNTSEPGPSHICVITDSNVAGYYLDGLEQQLSGFDIPVFHHIIPAGEEYKNLETVSLIYDTLSNHQFGRADMIIALGGGVTGDIAGFAAATFLRGIKHLVQIPTTLLAQVDSSVGGKTGVDLPQGKNLVGAFRQPDLVLIDPQVLDTLPKSVFKAGMAEVIKYGCISDPEILEMVTKDDYKDRIIELIESCVRIKIKVVEEDETEEGIRRILNFGHTIGHSVEKLGNFTELSHGEAVSIGMTAAVKIGLSLGITRESCVDRLTEILQGFSLPTEITRSVEDVYEALLSDKKKQGDSIHFVLIEDFGKALVKKIAVTELKQIMKVLGD